MTHKKRKRGRLNKLLPPFFYCSKKQESKMKKPIGFILLFILWVILVTIDIGKRQGDPVMGMINDIIFYILWGALMVVVLGMATYKLPEEKESKKTE
jgi:hypothetical protein